MQRSLVIKKNILLLKVKASVWENEKVLEMDGCDGCMALWVCSMPLNFTLKKGEMGNFMLFI